MSAAIGHNRGPAMDEGHGWRTHCWQKARAELLPVLPLEVIRTRLHRAAELGLDYRTYAGIRASSGHDLIALLFSSNALRVLRVGQPGDPARLEKLCAVRNTGKLLAVQPPLAPEALCAALAAGGLMIDLAARAPGLADGWGATRARLRAMLAPARLPSDRVLVIGETALERGWSEAGHMAGFLPADRYFAIAAQAHRA
jgi:hypothetical protein